jgi:hypothetical protein
VTALPDFPESITEVPAAGDGILSAVVWPTYAGAVKGNGEEPMFGLEYQRGPIFWELEGSELKGHCRIQVPAGDWRWIIYCHNSFRPGFIHCQKLAQPLVLTESGTIDLFGITEDDVKPLQPDPVLHD